MNFNPNPVFGGMISVLSGSVVGDLADKVANFLSTGDLLSKLVPDCSSSVFLDALVGMFVQIGVMSAGTELISNALPFMAQDTSAFSMFLLGMWSSSPHLKKRIRVIQNLLQNTVSIPGDSAAPAIPSSSI